MRRRLLGWAIWASEHAAGLCLVLTLVGVAAVAAVFVRDVTTMHRRTSPTLARGAVVSLHTVKEARTTRLEAEVDLGGRRIRVTLPDKTWCEVGDQISLAKTGEGESETFEPVKLGRVCRPFRN